MKLSMFAAAAVVAGSLALAPGSASANHHYGHPGQYAPAVCPAPAPVYHQPVCQPVCKPACKPVCQVRYCDPCRRSGLLGLGILGIL